MSDPILPVLEVLRALDAFLFKVSCPHCGTQSLIGRGKDTCPTCYCEIPIVYDLSNTSYRNIVPIVDGKRRRAKGIGKRTVQALLGLQDHSCAYCGVCLRDQSYHVDHVVPIAVGGSNNFNNLVVACVRCNLLGSSKVFPTIASKRSYILKRRKDTA